VSRPRAGDKDLRTLLRAIEAAGCEVTGGGRGHWKVYHDGALVTVVSCSSSDRRFRLKVRNDLKRAGIEMP